MLIPFRPPRSDYQPLLSPVVEELSARGIPVTVCTWEADVGDAFDPAGFSDAEILRYDSVFDARSYLTAKRRYQSIAGDISDLCSWLDLGHRQIDRTIHFFKRYVLYWTLFEQVLEETEPDVLYNVHYTTTPGIVEAINDYERTQTLTNVLIQHGWFAWYPFHPHRKQDADVSILWGEHFAERLAENKVIPSTPTKVIGSPKIEQMREGFPIETMGEDVLYISSPSQPEYVRDALRLVAMVSEETDNWEVTYKAHPLETELKNYQQLIDDGLITRDQVVRDANVHKLIAESQIVVGTHSSVLLEALALDRVAIQLFPHRANNSWADMGMYASNSQEAFRSLINELVGCQSSYDQALDDEQRLKKRMFGTLNGVSKQIVDYLIQT